MSDWSSGFWARSGSCCIITFNCVADLTVTTPVQLSNVRSRNNYPIITRGITALFCCFKTATKWYRPSFCLVGVAAARCPATQAMIARCVFLAFSLVCSCDPSLEDSDSQHRHRDSTLRVPSRCLCFSSSSNSKELRVLLLLARTLPRITTCGISELLLSLAFAKLLLVDFLLQN